MTAEKTVKHTAKSTPHIHLKKRGLVPKYQILLIRLSAFVIAIILGGLIFPIAGENPITAYAVMISGSLGKASALRQIVKTMIPLLGTSIALAACFKMKYWNIGAEGQITMGAMAASFFALNYGDKWPSFILLVTMGIFSIIFGALWAIIPAFFKARFGTNETLFTLMMNYIAIGIVAWLQGGPWEGKPGSQIIPNFEKAAVLPKVFGVHCGWIIVLILTVFMYIYMKYTKHGYEIAVLGDSENTAKYAGMNVTLIMLRTAALSGGICGLMGFLVCSGTDQTLYSSVAGGVGFTAITVAWLSQLNPFVMIIISALLAILSKGSSVLQTSLAIPSSISDIITGIILLAMLACEFFINYSIVFDFGNNKEAK